MDIAREELMKKPDEISVEKLQSLLDLALRSTAAVADPYHEDLTCYVERMTLLKRLSTLKDLQISQIVSDRSDLEEPVTITGLETFSLSFKVLLTVTAPSCSLFLCFLLLKPSKECFNQFQFLHLGPMAIIPCDLTKSFTKYQLIFRFLFHCKHVNRQLCAAWQLHQVIEPNWHVLHNRLQTAKSIDETDIPDVDKYKQLKLRTRTQTRKVGSENATVIESILKFEREFAGELQSLGPILSSSSRAEPYLTHLAQWLLGVGRD
ncbi:UNVERIFIED_CONTAM: Gamma-tubulin complex component 2 [Sesamum radiatum]|uniref:Gamma-tubulin complex component n=1 Tax=Sesamum radiatum TaxID=300843 RepID=A0AAW2TF43_SESRA